MKAAEEIHTASVGEIELAYYEEGEGSPIVLVHGSLSDLRTWSRYAPLLARSHRAIAYSRRYSPPNALLDHGADDQMLPHVDDLIALIGALDAAPAHLIGDSWGAFIALLAAIRRPDLVRSVVLQEPPTLTLFTKPKPGPADLLRLLATRPRTAAAIVGFGAGTLAPTERALRRGEDERAAETFAGGVLGAEALAELGPERMLQALENVETLRGQLLGAGFPPLDDEDVRAVAAPVLLLNGERTRPFFLRLIDRLAELLPAAERAEIAGVTHSPHEQAPEAVAAATLAFLRRVDAG